MPRRTTASAKAAPPARVRMYRHGLGDCFLLRFPRDDGRPGTFNVLVDCGLISVAAQPAEQMAKVLADLKAETGGRLDAVVVTHEHWDHVSGFSTQQAQHLFDDLQVGEAWYAWTEDPADRQGRRLRDERAAKLAAVQAAAVALEQQAALAADAAARQEAEERARRVRGLLAFFGIEPGDPLPAQGLGAAAAAGGKSRQAFMYLAGRKDVRKRYLEPGDTLAPAGAAGVRVHVLGPPRDEGLIKRSAPTRKGREVYDLAGDVAMDANLGAAFARLAGQGDADAADGPFDAGFRCRPGEGTASLDALLAAVWQPPAQAWRRIDADWTGSAEALALNLDSHTNNTCLVLAFELVASGRVLLFAADAQVGNWLSWQSVKFSADGRSFGGPDLLARTVFYKVGHHGSHNATLRAQGLEQMTSPELVAFVPVSKAQAEKNRWMEMPFAPLVERLRERTGGRLVFSDGTMAAPRSADLEALSPAQREAFLGRLVARKLFCEYVLED